MSYFIFNGIDSRKYGVVSAMSLPPVAERNFTEKQIPGRPVPLNRLEVMRKNVQITVTMTVTDMSLLPEINSWFQGKGSLILDSDLTKKYIAYVSKGISPERILKLCGSFTIVFTAEPFRYSVENNPVIFGGTTDELIKYNTPVEGTADCEPLFYVTLAGRIEMTVNGGEPFIFESDGTPTIVNNTKTYKYSREGIFIDCALKAAYRINENGKYVIVTNHTWGTFPTLKCGRNEIQIRLRKENRVINGETFVPGNFSYEGFTLTKNERWY